MSCGNLIPLSVGGLTHAAVPVICYFLTLPKPSFAASSSKFDKCLDDIRSGKFGPDVGLNNKGLPVSNVSEATAIPYRVCVQACGSGPDNFDWDIFSTQFSSWLLPWLALLSQLPFGANDTLENLLSMALMVGSPMLAAYALALTVLNKRWLVKRFASFHFPHTKNAVIALSDLQQAPFIVTADLQLLTSLVMLRENEGWWNDLHVRMGEGYLWNTPAGMSIVWVIISYVFTVIGSFQNSEDVSRSIPSHGRGIGAVWFWLLPVVVGWLQLSPKCDLAKLRNALIHAHERVFMITRNGDIVPASTDTSTSAIPAIFFPGCENRDQALCRDRYCTAPLYNYARCFSWADSIESIALAYDLASKRLRRVKMSSQESQEMPGQFQELACAVAAVSSIEEEVETICEKRWPPHVWRRIVLASLLALLLQWGTTGAAIIVNYYTMTYGTHKFVDRVSPYLFCSFSGIGCRVMSEILYGCGATLSCILLIASTIFAQLASPSHVSSDAKPTTSSIWLRRLSILLRKLGKLLALLNALFIVLVCIVQFSNLFDRCWCNSSWIQRREKAFNVLDNTSYDLKEMRDKWIPGLALAAVAAGLYLGLLNLITPRIRR